MALQFFSKSFPLPGYLKPAHIGVSFSDSFVKAVYLNGHSSSNPQPKSITIPLEKGAIIEGNIVNAEEVSKKLSLIKKEINIPFAVFTLPDELTYVFSTSVPISGENNVIESVAFTIEENVPLSLSETVFDFVPVGIFSSEGGYKASVVVAAAVKKEVEKFVEVIKRGGFEALGCLPESQAIANSLFKKENGISCVICAGEKKASIFLVKNGIVHFSTIRSIVQGDYKKQLIDEFEKFLEYFSKYGDDKNETMKSLLVCGDFKFAKETIEAILDEHKWNGEAKLANVWTNILSIEKNPPSISYEESLALAGPLGAVLSNPF